MYTKHKHISTPVNDTIIWRYMDLWKFLDIIENNKLYLTRLDQFEDKYEGRIPKRITKNLEENNPLKKTDDYSEYAFKKSTYVSSWNIEQNETYPLWKIYSDYKTAVAIKTTIKRLIDSISNNERNQYIGKVNYLKPEGSYIFRGNLFQLALDKRDYFIFEKEVRIISTLPSENTEELFKLPKGFKIDIDSDKLIEEIYLAPLADDNLKALIELKLKELNLNKLVKLSDI
ncbi:MAG: hypothetical protein JW866_08985 [Ignavibacteriales bacterium]|nr:hypothetical protein [Ignavibacteriales bacterium]